MENWTKDECLSSISTQISYSSSSSKISMLNPSMELPNFSKFKIGLCQLSVTPDKNLNLEKAHKMIKSAANRGAKLVVLPEMWNCPYSDEYFSKHAEDFSNESASPTFLMLSDIAASERVVIVGGSVPEISNGVLYNTCCVFGSNGNLIAKHRKVHLFDVDIPGDIMFRESDIFTAGDTPTVAETEVGRIGIGICHDISFPELAMLYRERGAHLICYPSAFNMSTGALLWELVQRARADDNQVQIGILIQLDRSTYTIFDENKIVCRELLFVATCSPSRDSAGSYTIWGHSTLVGPFGEVIATSGTEETLVIADIDYSLLQHHRDIFPVPMLRQENIYKFIDVQYDQLNQPAKTRKS